MTNRVCLGFLAGSMLAAAAASCAGTDSAPSSAAPASPSGTPSPARDGAAAPSPTTHAPPVHQDADTADAAADAPSVPACDGGLARCGTACVDTQTDGENCGGCGLACASCTQGECIETLFADGGVPLGIAVDSTRVYWVDFKQWDVKSALLDGGDLSTLATVQGYPKDIAVDEGHVYWITAGAGTPYGTVMRASLDGGAQVALATEQAAPQRLRLAPNHRLYWVNGWPSEGDSGALASVDVDGGAVSATAAGTNGLGALSANAVGVYWYDGQQAAIVTASLDGGAPSTLVAASGVSELAVDTTRAYWTDWSANRVMTAPLDGGAPTEFAAALTGGPVGIAIDAQYVYWCEDGGLVVKAPKEGGTPRALATGLGGGCQYLVIGGDSLYFTQGAAVRKITPR